MQLVFDAGQTIRVNFEQVSTNELTITLTTVDNQSKRGPKSLPKSDVKSIDFHQPILNALTSGPLFSEEIRDIIGETPETRNTISWALVELQNEDCRRGKNVPKTGPVVKLADGRYALRS